MSLNRDNADAITSEALRVDVDPMERFISAVFALSFQQVRWQAVIRPIELEQHRLPL